MTPLFSRTAAWTQRLADSRPNLYFLAIAVAAFALNQIIEYSVRAFAGVEGVACRWDCADWYAGIVDHGYDVEPHGHDKGDAANWVFFPFFPLAASLLSMLTSLAPPAALVLTSKLIFVLAIFAFMKFGVEYQPRLKPLVLAGVAALNPYAIYGSAGYTESSFLLFSCLFFIALGRRNYVLAGLFGGVLTSVRLVGGAVGFSYLARLWQDRRALREAGLPRILLGLFLVPLGAALFAAFLYLKSGDALAFMHLERAWGREPGNPIVYLLETIHGDRTAKLWGLMTVGALLVPLYFAFRRRFDLAVYPLLCTLVPLSTGMWAMPRYIWWQAPLLLAVTLAASNKYARFVVMPAFAVGLAYTYFAWFSGEMVMQ